MKDYLSRLAAGTPTARAAKRLFAAPAYPQQRSWTANPRGTGKLMRSRGSLTHSQLQQAEDYALKNGIALGSPTNKASRVFTLTMVWNQMVQAGVAKEKG
jgi:hypothetical protein